MADRWQQIAYVALMLAGVLGLLSFCLSAASVGLSTAPDEAIIANNVNLLSKYRAMDYSTTTVIVPAYDLQTANGLKQMSEMTYNFTIFFGMSSVGTYASETYANGYKTVFGYTQFLPCNYVNHTEPDLMYISRRRLDTASDFASVQNFNPCRNGVAETCEEAYQSTYAHFAAALVFALFAVPLHFYRAHIIKTSDSFLVFAAVSVAWLLVFILMAAGAGSFYSRCVEPAVKFLEADFSPFDGAFERGYGPVTDIAITASFFASMCFLTNLFFFYRPPGRGGSDDGALADKGEDDASGGPRDSTRLSKQISVTPKKKKVPHADGDNYI